MALFRKKTAQVIRRGDAAEDRKVRRVGEEEVVVRKFSAPATGGRPTDSKTRTDSSRGSAGTRAQSKPRSRTSGNGARARRDDPRRALLAVVPPPETARKQMLVRSNPHQTQIVVMEGPVLVEHYVTRSDRQSLVGNVYMGKVRNVLPGMEAAFVDFGEGKNGVLYAGDVNYDDAEIEGKRARIEMVLKPGDSVLVQVVKDAMGKKGARLTSQISLAGRYLVLAPDAEVNGISRRLSDDERRRLRDIVADIRPEGMGIIVRTAAQDASRDDLAADVARLEDVWQHVAAKKSDSPAPSLIYEEPPLVLRVIREHFTKDFRRLFIDDPEVHRQVLGYLEGTEPELDRQGGALRGRSTPHLRAVPRRGPAAQGARPQGLAAVGGHIVVDRTEALTVIDVNTGRFVGHTNLEQTVLQNNLEAAEEIARQLRLRDIGGIIVIDFIDMEISKNREAVLLRLREHLAKDKTRTQVFEVSNLGLVEMTRKNVSAGLLESFSDVCPSCNGRGVVLYEDSATQGTPLPRAVATDPS